MQDMVKSNVIATGKGLIPELLKERKRR